MVTIAPPRSIEQRFAALGKANSARSGPVAFRAEMRALPRRDAALLAARVLIEEPERIGAMRVHKLLEAVPRLGPVKVRRILSREQIWPLRTVGSVSPRQRTILAGELVRHAARLGGGNER